MQILEVSDAVRHIYIYIYVIRRLKVNNYVFYVVCISWVNKVIEDSVCFNPPYFRYGSCSFFVIYNP